MKNTKQQLIELKKSFLAGSITIVDLQRALSQQLLMSGLSQAESLSQKFDNDVELIIYTLPNEKQFEAVTELIDKALSLIDGNTE